MEKNIIKSEEVLVVVESIDDSKNDTIVSKLGNYYKNIVASFRFSDMNKTTALELVRVEAQMAIPLAPQQVEVMERRISQIEKICKLMGADNNLFTHKVAQLKELCALKSKQWIYALESTEAELVKA